MQISAVILAGGKSTRMGLDKARLAVGEKTLLEIVYSQLSRFEQILISGNPETLNYRNWEIIPDEKPGLGPLGALSTILKKVESEWVFLVACDQPKIPQDLIDRLIEQIRPNIDVVVPITVDGYLEPLFALYSKSTLPYVEKSLEKGFLRLDSFYKNCSVKYLPFTGKLDNLNTIDQFESWLSGEQNVVVKS